MLVARFSEDIQNDLRRGFSSYMLPGLCGSYEDNIQDCEDFGYSVDKITEFEGKFSVKHHDGLSCYYLESETVEEAIEEVRSDSRCDGSGWAEYTIGEVRLLKTIPAKEFGSQRDLHILEVEDCETEQF